MLGLGVPWGLAERPATTADDLILNALADTVPGIRRAGDPRRLRSAWINAVKELPVAYA